LLEKNKEAFTFFDQFRYFGKIELNDPLIRNEFIKLVKKLIPNEQYAETKQWIESHKWRGSNKWLDPDKRNLFLCLLLKKQVKLVIKLCPNNDQIILLINFLLQTHDYKRAILVFSEWLPHNQSKKDLSADKINAYLRSYDISSYTYDEKIGFKKKEQKKSSKISLKAKTSTHLFKLSIKQPFPKKDFIELNKQAIQIKRLSLSSS
jgi:hypothetical protein